MRLKPGRVRRVGIYRYVADLGLAGPDRGAGGRYLILPPGYDGEEPDGYFTYRTPTFTNWLVVRALGGVDDIVKTRGLSLWPRRSRSRSSEAGTP